MKQLERRIQNLEQQLGFQPETVFERRLRSRLEAGIERARKYRKETGTATISNIEVRTPSGRVPLGRVRRTIAEILIEGRERAAAREESSADADGDQG